MSDSGDPMAETPMTVWVVTHRVEFEFEEIIAVTRSLADGQAVAERWMAAKNWRSLRRWKPEEGLTVVIWQVGGESVSVSQWPILNSAADYDPTED